MAKFSQKTSFVNIAAGPGAYHILIVNAHEHFNVIRFTAAECYRFAFFFIAELEFRIVCHTPALFIKDTLIAEVQRSVEAFIFEQGSFSHALGNRFTAIRNALSGQRTPYHKKP